MLASKGLDANLDTPLDRAVHGLVLATDAFVTRMRKLIDSRADDPGVPTLGRLRLRPRIEKIIAAVADALGYRGASSVTQALLRVEQDPKRIASTLAKIE